MTKIMLSAGEASGDLHGASVAAAIRAIDPGARLFGMGGARMRAAGVDIVYDIADLGVIGIIEVIRNLPKLFRVRDLLAETMERERPDVLVVIDYPGFNVRLARIAKDKGIPVVSYISPSAWAWGRGRAREVAGIVERVAAIFPFEADVYREAGANVTFVGHPLLDVVKPTMSRDDAFRHFGADPARPVVLLMPGSRRQEIENLLPPMLSAAEQIARNLPDCQFFLPLASTISQEIMQNRIAGCSVDIRLAAGNIHDLMNIAGAAVASSGTVTLEAALMGLPSVIIYRVNSLTYLLGRMLVKIPDIGLPNIVAGRRILPELLQDAVQPDAIAGAVIRLLTDPAERARVLADLDEVRSRLGETGAVGRVARVILEVAEKEAP